MTNIFHYNCYVDYLKSVVKEFSKEKQKPSSLGEWALRLGYKSPRSFGMVLKGSRLPSEQLLESLSRYLKLRKKERDYLFELVRVERLRRKEKPLDEALNRLKKLNPEVNEFMEINPAKFSYIADWYNLVLKQLLAGKSLVPDPKQISLLLRGKVSPKEVSEGLDNLMQLGFLKKNVDGTLTSTDIGLNTTNDIPSDAIKFHHKGMILRALESLYEQSHLKREFQTLTLAFDSSEIEEAKDAIRQFKSEFNARFASDDSDQVFQLNMQFFEHTLSSLGDQND